MSGKKLIPTCACSSALTSLTKSNTTKINRCPRTAWALSNNSIVIVKHVAGGGPDDNEQTFTDLVLKKSDYGLNHMFLHEQEQEYAMQKNPKHYSLDLYNWGQVNINVQCHLKPLFNSIHWLTTKFDLVTVFFFHNQLSPLNHCFVSYYEETLNVKT